MNKRYRLGEIEEAVSEMEELIDTQDDIAEIDDDFQIVVSGWSVYVERLNLTLRQGVACIWDTEAGLFMPDFDVTIVYEGNIETQEWLYYEQDGMVVTLGNWLNGRLSCEVDYSQKEQKHPFTKAVLAPMKAVKKLLVSMELHLDASIDKLDNLAMNVQFDKEKRMEQTKDKEQKAPDTEREIIYSPMVAEPQEYKYNADAFAARKTSEAILKNMRRAELNHIIILKPIIIYSSINYLFREFLLS